MTSLALIAALLLAPPVVRAGVVDAVPSAPARPPSPVGPWKAALELAGGPLRFSIVVEPNRRGWRARLCNSSRCDPFSSVRQRGDSLVLELADYAASITARLTNDSLTGAYHNVGSRGPRTIPFRAARGTWPAGPPPPTLLGRWDAWFETDGRRAPRRFEFRAAPAGMEGTIVGSGGDFGLFWGTALADSFDLAHFDGSFVYRLTGRLDGDTLRGVFHAGLRTQTPFVAVRSIGAAHLRPPSEVVQGDTSQPFRFRFPDLSGRSVTEADPRFRGKIVLVNIMGTWCPTCHDAEPALIALYRRYHARGLEMVGLAYEVTGDTAVDGALVRRFRDKFGVPFPILLAGISDAAAAAATQPQLSGPIAFPTLIFLGRDGRVRATHAGFYGPALDAPNVRLVAELDTLVQGLLAEPHD